MLIHVSECITELTRHLFKCVHTCICVYLRVCAYTPHPLQGAQLQSIQVPLSYFQQSIFGPLTEPVNGGAVDESWVLEDAVPVRNTAI